ncbi:hypothetical protein CDO52_26805 [Nocardiopsis gilva YIM 90087]|uniref:Uncharacterized protein n=1 Tax=Nocardiopsis gilva YIM 90087 TaxID=1235441 RepID=A0A223SCQ2_9ACTN|nr:hypothetical protein CDO52_26805 [Nocardiopsis gilva YIM 90087]
MTLSRVAGTFTWNTGEVSDYVGSVNTDPRQGVVEINFKVKNGPLSGDTGTVAPVVARTNADCLTVGLRTLDLEAFQIVFQ